jgi:hypothetical protein
MQKRRKTPLMAVGALIILAALFASPGQAGPRTLLMLPPVTLLFLGLHFCPHWSTWARAGFSVFAVGAGAVFSVSTLERIARNLSQPSEWDYLGFWLHARTTALDLDFYDPANARTLVEPYDISMEIRIEIVDAGFWYPPPSMFVFWPLGSFSEPMAALPLWYGLILLSVVATIFLLWGIFSPNGGVVEWLGCMALVLTLHGAYSTFHYSQTSFFALLAFLLYWKYRRSWAGGLWAPTSVFVKPFLAVLAAGPVLARRWRVITGMLISGTVLTAAAAVAFGPGSFVDFVAKDQVGEKPDWIYSEPTNQSLLGLVLRVTDAECRGTDCVTNPVFLVGATLLALATLILGFGLQRVKEEDCASTLFLLLAMTIYPVSQLFYSVLLIPLGLLVWQRRERLAGGPWSISVLLAMVCALAAMDRGRATVLAFILLLGGHAPGRHSARPRQGLAPPTRPTLSRLETGASAVPSMSRPVPSSGFFYCSVPPPFAFDCLADLSVTLLSAL